MAVFLPVARRTRRARYRANVLHNGRRVSFFAALVALILRVPFAVQFVLVIVAAIALGSLVGTLLGGAAAARDLGLVR